MNEPDDQGAVTHELPEIIVAPDPLEEAPPASAAIEAPGDGVPSAEPPAAPPPIEEPLPEEPPIERHDPFAYMRNAPWMDRRLSPSGRGAILLRRDLDAFPVIEGRDPNLADLKAIAQRTVDYIVPIIKREQLTDYAYEELEKRRDERIAKKREATLPASPDVDPNIVLVGSPRAEADYLQLPQFRDVSNYNVGLFMQQAGFPLWLTMVIAGKYAERYSGNHRPDQRDGLDPRTRAWIERGYEDGDSGVFTPALAGAMAIDKDTMIVGR